MSLMFRGQVRSSDGDAGVPCASCGADEPGKGDCPTCCVVDVVDARVAALVAVGDSLSPRRGGEVRE